MGGISYVFFLGLCGWCGGWVLVRLYVVGVCGDVWLVCV